MLQILSVVVTVLWWLLLIALLPFMLVYKLIRRLMGKAPAPPVKQSTLSEDLELRTSSIGERTVVNANLETLSKAEQREFQEVSLKNGDFTMYEGHIKHAYDSGFVSDLECCPKCHAATRQMYSNFVYATQKELRVMWAPAGYFCTKCPTMIVDQNIVRNGVSRRFKFRGVLGLSHPKTDDFEPYSTWNGQKAVYVMDEDGGNVELTTADMLPEDAILYHPPQSLSDKQRERKRRRKKLAKESRKKNRRRKK